MGSIQQVIFKLSDEEYGVDIMKVSGVEKHQEIVKVPNSPEYIEGIINLRGEVLPVYNIRKKFKLAAKEVDDNTKIVVINTNSMKIGFVVDAVSEIVHIDEDNIEQAPKIVTGISRKYIKSIAKQEGRMIILIDIDLIVSDEEYEKLEEVIESN